jgi:hypothetical protein
MPFRYPFRESSKGCDRSAPSAAWVAPLTREVPQSRVNEKAALLAKYAPASCHKQVDGFRKTLNPTPIEAFFQFAMHSGTELTLTRERLPDEAARASHEHGWSGLLDKLPVFLGVAL